MARALAPSQRLPGFTRATPRFTAQRYTRWVLDKIHLRQPVRDAEEALPSGIVPTHPWVAVLVAGGVCHPTPQDSGPSAVTLVFQTHVTIRLAHDTHSLDGQAYP